MVYNRFESPLACRLPTSNLVLYVTDHCSLCDVALDLLTGTGFTKSISLETVDIAQSDNLFAEYGERIPVLSDGETELNWPFDVEAIEAMLG